MAWACRETVLSLVGAGRLPIHFRRRRASALMSKCWLGEDGERRGDQMEYRAINFVQKFDLFDEQWQPKVIAEMNDYQFKVVKLQGDLIWHDHKDTDETFIVIEGDLRIDFRDGAVHIGAGEMFVVPKRVEHKPYAES